MKMFDPYYKLDPTRQREIEPQQGRSASGRFTTTSVLNGMADDDFPIDSNFWRRYAIGTRLRLDTTWGEDFRRMVLPNESIMSWRMICEMYEAARDAKLAGKSDEDAITAAHDYLATKQRKTYTALREQLSRTVENLPAPGQSDAIDAWIEENWDLIPEIPL